MILHFFFYISFPPIAWFPHNLESLAKCPFFEKFSGSLEKSEKSVEKYLSQGIIVC